ncbi:MAG: PP2C family protein-serine/threonine phosphatase, partial [Prochloraceae cyanobacterium]
EMARHHEGKSRLQFFVGCSHLPSDLPTYTLKLEPNDLLLLCSDGISGSLMPEDIANILASRQNLQEKAKSLVNKALDNKETDNQTLILWSHSPASSVSNSKNKSNNSSFIPSEEDETQGGINLFKLLVLPLIFIGSLAFGAYYFGFSFSRNPQAEITQEATNNQDQERENDSVETSVTEENSQQISLNPPENQEQIIQNNHFSCDSDPQPPSSVSPNDKLKLYVRYDREDEFDRVEQLLLTVCPRPDNDRTKKSFHKIPNEFLFEVWFDRASEREHFKTKIAQEKRERGLLFVDVLPRENLESQDNI